MRLSPGDLVRWGTSYHFYLHIDDSDATRWDAITVGPLFVVIDVFPSESPYLRLMLFDPLRGHVFCDGFPERGRKMELVSSIEDAVG